MYYNSIRYVLPNQFHGRKLMFTLSSQLCLYHNIIIQQLVYSLVPMPLLASLCFTQNVEGHGRQNKGCDVNRCVANISC